jgi:hypothetical protein
MGSVFQTSSGRWGFRARIDPFQILLIPALHGEEDNFRRVIWVMFKDDLFQSLGKPGACFENDQNLGTPLQFVLPPIMGLYPRHQIGARGHPGLKRFPSEFPCGTEIRGSNHDNHVLGTNGHDQDPN